MALAASCVDDAKLLRNSRQPTSSSRLPAQSRGRGDCLSPDRLRCRSILLVGSGAALFCRSEALPLNLLVGRGAALSCQSEALPLYPANRKRCRSIYWLEAMLLYTYGRQRSRSILPFGVDASLF